MFIDEGSIFFKDTILGTFLVGGGLGGGGAPPEIVGGGGGGGGGLQPPNSPLPPHSYATLSSSIGVTNGGVL